MVMGDTAGWFTYPRHHDSILYKITEGRIKGKPTIGKIRM